MKRTPRPYQLSILAEARAAVARGSRAPLVQLPTGAGKSLTAILFVKGAIAKGKRVLWAATRVELVKQPRQTMHEEGLTDVGVIAAPLPHLRRPSAPVQIASLQTLLARDEAPPADLVVLDEARHYCSAEWRKIVAAYPNAVLLGLDATPVRGDGSPLGRPSGPFDYLIVGPSVAELQAMGALVPCETIAPDRHLRGKLAQHPVDAWREHAGGRPTIVFAQHVAHGKELEREFRAAGARARFVDQETPAVLREHALRDFASGACNVLINVYILTEGFDCPSAAVCILARSCGSVGMYIQCTGRILRPAPGKRIATLIDLAGSVHLHGLIEDPREYSLEGRGIIPRKQLPALRVCPECGCTARSAAVCKRCGYTWPAQDAPTVVGESLSRITSVSAEDQAAVFAQLLGVEEISGRRRGWALDEFRRRFGHWPSYRTQDGKVVAA